MRLCFLWAVFCLTIPIKNDAQNKLNLSYGIGKIIKHDPKIPLVVPQRSYGLEASYKKRLIGNAHWESFYNFPYLELNLSYHDFGDNQNLGQAFAFHPGLEFFFFQKKKVHLGFRMSIGLSYITEIYDEETNAENTFISSHFNDLNQFSLAPRFRLSKHFSFDVGVAFTHFSNSGVRLPNKGINMFKSYVAISYDLKKDDNKEHRTFTVPAYKTDGINLVFNAGINKMADYPDRDFSVISLAALYFRKVNPYQNWLGGIEYEFNAAWQAYVNDHPEDEETGADAASNLSLYLAHELEFGSVLLRLGSGLYFEPNKWKRIAPFYFRLQTGYMVKFGALRFATGLSIKAHYFRAESLSVFSSIYW